MDHWFNPKVLFICFDGQQRKLSIDPTEKAVCDGGADGGVRCGNSRCEICHGSCMHALHVLMWHSLRDEHVFDFSGHKMAQVLFDPCISSRAMSILLQVTKQS